MAGLGRGPAIFLLGSKYGSVSRGGVPLAMGTEDAALGRSIWEPFMDVYESLSLRAKMEPVLRTAAPSA